MTLLAVSTHSEHSIRMGHGRMAVAGTYLAGAQKKNIKTLIAIINERPDPVTIPRIAGNVPRVQHMRCLLV